MLKARRSETIKVVKVALSPDPIESLKAPEAPETYLRLWTAHTAHGRHSLCLN